MPLVSGLLFRETCPVSFHVAYGTSCALFTFQGFQWSTGGKGRYHDNSGGYQKPPIVAISNRSSAAVPALRPSAVELLANPAAAAATLVRALPVSGPIAPADTLGIGNAITTNAMLGNLSQDAILNAQHLSQQQQLSLLSLVYQQPNQQTSLGQWHTQNSANRFP